MTDPAPALAVEGLRFGWGRGPDLIDIPALHLARGERLFLFGPSGSGKSTLLNLVAGTLPARAGEVRVAGDRMTGAGRRGRDRLRADHIGVVFQQFNLLPFLPVIDNVLLPCRFSRRRAQRAMERDGTLDAAARRLLDALGLHDPALLRRDAGTLSVGQQQRVAAARALIGTPELVICDEPTSALDADARDGFLALLLAECAAAGAALLFVSHDHGLAAHFSRQASLPMLNRAGAQA